MAVTIGVQQVPSDQEDVIQANVLLNSDKALTNPLSTLTTEENLNQIFTALGISSSTHNIGQVSLNSVVAPLFDLFTYNFSMRFSIFLSKNLFGISNTVIYHKFVKLL